MTAAVILAGGQGSRLRPALRDRPKPLAPVAGCAFIDHLVRQLAAAGQVSKVVVAAGYKAEMIAAHCAAPGGALPIIVSTEPEPLGTGGAVLHAIREVDDDRMIVLNGDSYVDIDLADVLAGHAAAGPPVSLVAVRSAMRGRYGALEVSDGRLRGFVEKAGDGPGWINGGVYVFERGALDEFTPGRQSLEVDMMPVLIERGVNVICADGAFIDIGTPADYRRADAFFADLNLSAGGPGA